MQVRSGGIKGFVSAANIRIAVKAAFDYARRGRPEWLPLDVREKTPKCLGVRERKGGGASLDLRAHVRQLRRRNEDTWVHPCGRLWFCCQGAHAKYDEKTLHCFAEMNLKTGPLKCAIAKMAYLNEIKLPNF